MREQLFPTTSTTEHRYGKILGGKQQAQRINRSLAPLVDVMIGNEEDFTAALGFSVEGLDQNHSQL